MIPKRLFYCWFGRGNMSTLNQECLESWKKYLNDWEIVCIDEDNFDITTNEYSKQAYEHGNWSFVSDVARAYVLEKYGGLYLDTDVLILQPIDLLLDNNAIISMMSHGFYNSHMMGCEKDKFPDIFRQASIFEKGKAIHTELNKAIYKRYDIKGEEYIQIDGIGFYGNTYIANKITPVLPQTLMIHKEENTWVDGWKNGFMPQSDFMPFDIYIDKHKDIELSQRWFKNQKPIGKLYIDSQNDVDLYVIDYGNYFYNPKTVGLKGKGFYFRRDGDYEKIVKKSLCDGTILEYIQ